MDGFHEERPVIDVIQLQQCSNLTRAIWRNNIDLSNSQRYEKWCTILIVLYNENFHVIDVAIYESSWAKIWRAFRWSTRSTRYRWQFIMLVFFRVYMKYCCFSTKFSDWSYPSFPNWHLDNVKRWDKRDFNVLF